MVLEQLTDFPSETRESAVMAADVLIVDDDEAIPPLMALCLEMEGYRVASATGGREALSFLHTQPLPKLVILDVLMPEMDGLAVLRAIRADPDTAGLTVAMMSGLGDVSDSALERGIPAEYCLPKPISLGDLRRLTRRVCGACR
jgi:CheY-like chemotaxis protein